MAAAAAAARAGENREQILISHINIRSRALETTATYMVLLTTFHRLVSRYMW